MHGACRYLNMKSLLFFVMFVNLMVFPINFCQCQRPRGKSQQQFGRSETIRNSCRWTAERFNYIGDWRHFGRCVGHYPHIDCILCTRTIETWQSSWSTTAYVEFPAFANASAISTAIDCVPAGTNVNTAATQSRIFGTRRVASSHRRIDCTAVSCAFVLFVARRHIWSSLSRHIQRLSRGSR